MDAHTVQVAEEHLHGHSKRPREHVYEWLREQGIGLYSHVGRGKFHFPVEMQAALFRLAFG